MNVNPSATFTAILEGAGTGLVGTVGVRILNADTDAIVLVRQTSGIAEAVSGTYEAQLAAPSSPGEYIIVWDTGGTDPTAFASEPLTVGGVAPEPTITRVPGSSAYRLPHANATITSIQQPGVSEDWDRTTTTTAVWTGTADAYIRKTTSRETGDGSSSQIVSRQILLPRRLPLEIGSKISLLTLEGTAEEMTIRSIDRLIPPVGLAGPVRVTAEAA